MKSKKLRQENKYFILDKPYYPDFIMLLKRAAKALLAIKYRVYLSLCAMGVKEREKKFKVCICAIFKDESEILKEWIEYHLIVGIEHFYLYNNNSSDGFREILEPYIKTGIVTLVEWPKRHAQMEAYEDCIRKYANETKWLGFIDLDEFVVPLESTTVYDFLRKYDKRAGSILIYWRVFGSSGLVHRDINRLFTEQFTQAFPKWNDIGKCFYNTDFEFGGNVDGKNAVMHHCFWCRWGKHFIPPINPQNRIAFSDYHVLYRERLPIQINHYVTKSYHDYYIKTNIKSDVFFEKNPRSMDKFFAIDSFCVKQDFNIHRFLVKLKLKIGEDRREKQEDG